MRDCLVIDLGVRQNSRHKKSPKILFLVNPCEEMIGGVLFHIYCGVKLSPLNPHFNPVQTKQALKEVRENNKA